MAAIAAVPPVAAPAASSISPSFSSGVAVANPLSASASAALVQRLSARMTSHATEARYVFLGNYDALPSSSSSSSAVTTTSSSSTSALFGLDEPSAAIKVALKAQFEYKPVLHLSGTAAAPVSSRATAGVGRSATATAGPRVELREEATGVIRRIEVEDDADDAPLRSAAGISDVVDRAASQLASTTSIVQSAAASSSTALVLSTGAAASAATPAQLNTLVLGGDLNARQALIRQKREFDEVRPVWHAPWKLMRLISSHTGWVRCIAVDHSNEWFATGSVDRTIKIFDLASGSLKLTLTGHVSAVRGLAISKLTPYLFSIGEDKRVKCWDMTCNNVIRDYHGHLSGGYCISTLEAQGGINVLVTGGRDSVARVWDVRTAAEVAVLTGHSQTVAAIATQTVLPQVITGSHDSTIKLWDLRNTKAALSTLTHHKKSVRALQLHHTEYTFTSGAGDNIKVWKCPDGTFLRNIIGHITTLNALALNRDNVLVSGGDNGSLKLWDYKSGYCFQSIATKPQPGSLDAESGIFALAFDQTGSRLLTAETDKSIKVYKEDENATEETHPLDWRPAKRIKRF